MNNKVVSKAVKYSTKRRKDLKTFETASLLTIPDCLWDNNRDSLFRLIFFARNS